MSTHRFISSAPGSGTGGACSIRKRCSILAVSAIVWWVAPTPALAQFSKARADFEKVRTAQGNINLDKDRTELLSAAKTLYEVCGSLKDSLSSCGRELLDFGTGYADERGKPKRQAANVSGQAEVTRAALDSWMRLLNSTENHKSEGERVLAQTAEISKQWSELTRRVDETRSFLANGLQNATKDKDRITQDCRPVEEAQNAAVAKLTAAQRANSKADEEHNRALERVVSAEAKENEAYERYCAAATKGSKPDEVFSLRQQWARAFNDENDALGGAFSAFQALQSTREELGRAYAQLGQVGRDMRSFTAATDTNKIVENYNYFVRWNELFEKEFN